MKKLTALLIIGLFASCTSDSVNDLTDVAMTGYKIEAASSPDYTTVIIGSLINNKLFTENYQFLHNGVVESEETVQRYFYNPDGTLNHYKRTDGLITNLYYDNDANLIGARLFQEGSENGGNYRFIHHSNSEVYFERIDLPYDNPNAMATIRIIIHFNNNDEVISAGRDFNFDGVMENVNTFEYSNGNLTAIHYYDGTNENYQYSTIIDNFSILRLNSHGKKNLYVLCGECFGYLNQFNNVNLSRNVLQSVSTSATFQVLPNHFYEFKTEFNDSNGLTTNTQFFFE